MEANKMSFPEFLSRNDDFMATDYRPDFHFSKNTRDKCSHIGLRLENNNEVRQSKIYKKSNEISLIGLIIS